MKSNVCKLGKDLSCLETVLAEVEKTASYNALDTKASLRLRLLAEELCGMLPGLIQNFGGEFWVENKDDEYSLCAKIHAEDMDAETKEGLIALSSSGENAADKGIMGKIRHVAEKLLLFGLYTSEMNYSYGCNMGFMMAESDGVAADAKTYTWSLTQYKFVAEEKKDEDAMEELERSIVANLADDILVGVRGKNVEIVVKKAF